MLPLVHIVLQVSIISYIIMLILIFIILIKFQKLIINLSLSYLFTASAFLLHQPYPA